MAETKIPKEQLVGDVVVDVKDGGTLVKADAAHINFQHPLDVATDGEGVAVSIGSIAGLPGKASDDQTPETHGNTKHSPAMIEVGGNVTQSNMGILTGGEETSLHHHPAALGEDFYIGWGLGEIINGAHHLLGVNEQAAANQTVNSGNSPVVNNIYGLLSLINVKTLTASGTLRITGTAYDPSTGIETPNTTLDLSINSTGYYLGLTLWVGNITLSAIGGLNVIIDIARFVPYGLGNPKCELDYLLYSCKGVTGAAQFRIELFKFNPVAKTLSSIYDKTLIGSNGISMGRYREWESGDVSFNFPSMEFLYGRITVTSIEDFQFQIGFKRT